MCEVEDGDPRKCFHIFFVRCNFEEANSMSCDEASEAMQEHTVFDEEIEAKPAESAVRNGTQN